MEDFQGLTELPCDPVHTTADLITSVDFQNDGNSLICVADSKNIRLFTLTRMIAACQLDKQNPRFLCSLR